MYAIGLLLATSLGCEEPPEPVPPVVDAPPPEAPPFPLGRWVPATDGNLHCLELGADGAFELTRRGSGHGPETVARGRYVLEGEVLTLHVATLHRERWVSRCRKHVTPAGPVEVLQAFGTELRPAHETRWRLRRVDDGLELCGPRGQACELLRRNAD